MNNNNNNIKTLKFVCEDNFSNYVYKCIESNILYKDLSPDSKKPELYSCGNEIDGDPCYPIKLDNVKFIDRVVINRANQFNYMMLGRLKSDCDYFLGNGNGFIGHLWAKNINEQIQEMKRIYNIFDNDNKPEWLTYTQILEYESKMLNYNKNVEV